MKLGRSANLGARVLLLLCQQRKLITEDHPDVGSFNNWFGIPFKQLKEPLYSKHNLIMNSWRNKLKDCSYTDSPRRALNKKTSIEAYTINPKP